MAIVARRHIRWEGRDADEYWELKWLTDGSVMRKQGNQWHEIDRDMATHLLTAMQLKGGRIIEHPTPGAIPRLAPPPD